MLTKKISTLRLDPAIETKIETTHRQQLELVRKNARFLAEKNLPGLTGDKLQNHIGESTAGYETLAAQVLEEIQPATCYPKSKVDAEYFKARCQEIDEGIGELERRNQDDRYQLDGYNPRNTRNRFLLTIFLTGVIFIGEAFFNTKAMLITGDNLLFALILSICFSFAIFLFSHASTLLYRNAKTPMKRRLVVIISILLVTGIFTALAVFRSRYLAAHDISVAPKYFVIINLFCFIVSTLISFFILPTWEELKESALKHGTLRRIKRRKRTIKILAQEKTGIMEKITQLTNDRISITYLAKYSLNKIQKMHREAIAIFKSTNLCFRKDGKTPNCFSDHIDDIEVDINDQAFTQLKLKSE